MWHVYLLFNHGFLLVQKYVIINSYMLLLIDRFVLHAALNNVRTKPTISLSIFIQFFIGLILTEYECHIKQTGQPT